MNDYTSIIINKSMQLESKHQTRMTKFLEQKGFIVINITKSNWNGIPDLLVLIGGGKHFWIEAKKEDGVLSALQKFRIKSLTTMGDVVIVPYGYDDFIKQYEKHNRKGDLLPGLL